jgi:hypothetical protein
MSCQVVLNTRSNFHDFTLSPFPITTGGEWLDKTDLSPAWRIAGYGAIVGYAEQLPYGVLVLNDQRDSAFDAPESALEQARAAAGERMFRSAAAPASCSTSRPACSTRC